MWPVRPQPGSLDLQAKMDAMMGSTCPNSPRPTFTSSSSSSSVSDTTVVDTPPSHPSSSERDSIWSHLPPELIDLILLHLAHDSSPRSIATHLLVLSSHHRSWFLPTLYSHVILTSSEPIKKFSRTLREAPDLARMVRALLLRCDMWMGGLDENHIVDILQHLTEAREIEVGELESELIQHLPSHSKVESLTVHLPSRREPFRDVQHQVWYAHLKTLRLRSSEEPLELRDTLDRQRFEHLEDCTQLVISTRHFAVSLRCDRKATISALHLDADLVARPYALRHSDAQTMSDFSKVYDVLIGARAGAVDEADPYCEAARTILERCLRGSVAHASTASVARNDDDDADGARGQLRFQVQVTESSQDQNSTKEAVVSFKARHCLP